MFFTVAYLIFQFTQASIIVTGMAFRIIRFTSIGLGQIMALVADRGVPFLIIVTIFTSVGPIRSWG